MGRGYGGSILVHVGTNNTDKEGTTSIVEKYRNLLKKTKQARAGQICKEEEVGYVDLWDSFVRKEEMYVRDGLHLSGKGASVFAEGLSGAVASGLGRARYLN